MPSNKKPRMMIVATSSLFVRVFLRQQVAFLQGQGFDVTVVCSKDSDFEDLQRTMLGSVRGISLARAISPVEDCKALFALIRIMVLMRPGIVHTHTPKAGILGMAAAWLTRVPRRIHTVHGLRSETLSGWRCKVVTVVERQTVKLSTQVLAVSGSLREELSSRAIVPVARVTVLGNGSCAGIDLCEFDRNRHHSESACFRRKHKILRSELVITYIGRVAADKGIVTLAEAWSMISKWNSRAVLLIAGPMDETDPVPAAVIELLRKDNRVRFLEGFTDEAATILAASDVAIQPSYREGLGVAALEASAMCLPVVASHVTGLVDAVVHNHTGLLVEPGDSMALAEAVSNLLAKEDVRIEMGLAGRDFVSQNFDRHQVHNNLLQFYRSIVHKPPQVDVRIKRFIDLGVAVLAGILLSPVMLFAALLIRMCMGSPILFRQQRAGRDGEPFVLYKFRTMAPLAGPGWTEENRLTLLGKWLRKLSIDELPQLWNIVKGDMSLVGPRPLLIDYLPRYTITQQRRHEVLPGLTGWAQVNGRNSLSWEDKFAMDVWYVDHRSLWLDLKILALTAAKVFSMADITPRGAQSMHEFKGATDDHPTPVC